LPRRAADAKLIEVRPTAFAIVFYILFLLTQPCQDVLGAPPLTRGEASASQTEEDEDCEDGDDNCSPFCICSCRQAPAGYFSIETARESKVIIEPVRTTEIDYTRGVSASFTGSVWQPPKH
jgi:hypothetical protein